MDRLPQEKLNTMNAYKDLITSPEVQNVRDKDFTLMKTIAETSIQNGKI